MPHILLPAINADASDVVTQSDSQKTRAIAISFENKWKTLGLKKKAETRFTAQDSVMTLDPKEAITFYYRRHPQLSQISHYNWRLSFSMLKGILVSLLSSSTLGYMQPPHVSEPAKLR